MSNGQLLDRDLLVRTSDLDQGDWSHARGPLGWVIRSRYSMVMRQLRSMALPARPTFLEIGYGSGIFMPELAKWADRLIGVDIHEHPAEVQQALARVGVDAELRTGQVEDLPVPDASVDVVVALSCLEFVDDLPAAAAQIRRVLRPGGQAVVVTPGKSRLLDAGLTLLTGERPEDTFQGRRGRILPALAAELQPVATTVFPPRQVPAVPRMYTCARYRRPG